MKSIPFAQANKVIGANQPEYLPLHSHISANDPEGKVTTCFELTDEEVAEIIKTRKIWHVQLTFQGPLQPMSMRVDSPFFKHNDAYHQFFYKLDGAENGIWVWNACDLPAPQKLETEGIAKRYTLDRTKPHRQYTAMNLPVGAYYIAELPDTEIDYILEFGKHLLQRVTGPGLSVKFKIPA